MKVRYQYALAALAIFIAALVAASIFGCDSPRHTFSVYSAPLEWPQVYGNPLRDSKDRPIYANGPDPHLFIHESASNFSVARFSIYVPWPLPAFYNKPRIFRVRAVYRLNSLGRLPALGDTLRGALSWYEWAEGVNDTGYYYGRPLPDSIQVVASSIKAYPVSTTYYDLGGEKLGTAVTMNVDAFITTAGKSIGTWGSYSNLVHEDSVWVW